MPFLLWTEAPEGWNSLVINETGFTDTKVEVDGELGNEFDVKKAPGSDGATETNKGYEPCKPKVSWVLYTNDHFRDYQALLADVQPKPGKTGPSVVSIFHPQIQLHRKERFYVTKIHFLKHIGSNQMQAVWELLEYFPAPKPAAAATSTPVAAATPRERALETRTLEKPSKNKTGTLLP